MSSCLEKIQTDRWTDGKTTVISRDPPVWGPNTSNEELKLKLLD